MNLKSIRFYVYSLPDVSDQIVIGNKLIGRLNQHLDDIERPAADRDGNPASTQFAPAKVDLPWSGYIDQSFTVLSALVHAWIAGCVFSFASRVRELSIMAAMPGAVIGLIALHPIVASIR